MDDARKLCSASKKLEESQRLQLIGHHDSRLIYFFTGKGKQSFEEMVYENVWKAGEQFLKGLANHSGKKAHWSDSTMALMEDGDGNVGAAAPTMPRRQSTKGALNLATSAAADPPAPDAHREEVSLDEIKNPVWQLGKLGYKKGIVVSQKVDGDEKYNVIDAMDGTCALLRPAIIMGLPETKVNKACPY